MTKIRALYRVLFLLGVIPALFIVAFYVWQFAPLSGYTLSNEHSAWSDFGSYVGGLLGVWFAFLAFGGVLFTVFVLGEQLEHARERAHLDELQQVISNVSSTIDSVLNTEITTVFGQEKYTKQMPTVFTVLSGGGTAALNETEDDTEKAANDSLVTWCKETILLQVSVLGIELNQLVWCLEKYEIASGSPVVAEFYKIRYQMIVCWADAVGFFTDYERIQQYFEPSLIAKVARENGESVNL